MKPSRRTTHRLKALGILLTVAVGSLGPIGAAEGSASEEPGSTPALEARPFFFALSVSDAEASATWYRKVLGFRPARTMDLEERGIRIRLLKGEKAFLELIEDRRSRDLSDLDPAFAKRYLARGVFKIGFEVDNLDSAVSRLEGLGVELRGNVVTESDKSMRSAQIEDPDGNVLQLFEILDP